MLMALSLRAHDSIESTPPHVSSSENDIHSFNALLTYVLIYSGNLSKSETSPQPPVKYIWNKPGQKSWKGANLAFDAVSVIVV